MSTPELTIEGMAIPLAERVSLAQALRESIDAALADVPEDLTLREAIRREEGLSSGSAAVADTRGSCRPLAVRSDAPDYIPTLRKHGDAVVPAGWLGSPGRPGFDHYENVKKSLSAALRICNPAQCLLTLTL